MVGHQASDSVVVIESHHLFLMADSDGWALLRFRGSPGTDASKLLKRTIDVDALRALIEDADRVDEGAFQAGG